MYVLLIKQFDKAIQESNAFQQMFFGNVSLI